MGQSERKSHNDKKELIFKKAIQVSKGPCLDPTRRKGSLEGDRLRGLREEDSTIGAAVRASEKGWNLGKALQLESNGISVLLKIHISMLGVSVQVE